MAEVAYNDSTGEAWRLSGSDWVKAEQSVNEKTGEKFAFDGDKWVTVSRGMTATPPQDNRTLGQMAMGGLPGVVRGMRDIPHGLYQLGARTLENVAPKGSQFEIAAQDFRKTVEGKVAEAEQAYQAGRDPNAGFDVARTVGNVAASLPITALIPGAGAAALPARTASAVASGAASGAMNPVQDTENYWTEKGKQAGIGAVAGGVAAPVMTAASRMVQPLAATNEHIQTLMREGVRPTMGQIAGGVMKRVEDAATSIPFVGDIVRSAQRRSVEDFNRAAVNRALKPIGDELPKDMPVGREAVEYATSKVTDAYNNLLPRLNVAVDRQFGVDATNIIAKASTLEPKLGEQLNRIIDEKVLQKFAAGRMTGEEFKKVESELGTIASNYRTSSLASERELGAGVSDLQAAMRQLVTRSNPAEAFELSQINKAFANLARIQKASGGVGATDGVFSAPQLSNAVRSSDRSARHGQYAQGNAMMQDLSDAGRAVLPSSVPDSGTAARLTIGAGLMGAPAYLDPVMGGGLAALAGAYTPIGQRGIAHLMASRPDWAQPIANGIQALPPALAAGSAPFLYGVSR